MSYLQETYHILTVKTGGKNNLSFQEEEETSHSEVYSEHLVLLERLTSSEAILSAWQRGEGQHPKPAPASL
jgi:hypothetical protein